MIAMDILASAICYGLFHRQFFRCAETISGVPRLRNWDMAWSFGLNYAVLYACSVLELHLIVNWLLFLLLLFAEQLLLHRQLPLKSLLFALMGTQLGMALNVLLRGLMAVMFEVPLVAFNGHISMPGNRKEYPVLLGFLAAGLGFWLLTRYGVPKKLAPVLENRRTLTFLLGLFLLLHFYLYSSFLFYYVPGNSLTLKLWAIKSAVFVIAGATLTIVLSIRMGELAAYRGKSLEYRARLAREYEKARTLRTIASTDPLTGCENRAQADKCLQQMLEEKRAFCLGFADLNGLKAVNDKLGHAMGDEYLLSVARALHGVCGAEDRLFRYGGDEFLLLLFDVPPARAEERLRQAQNQLEQDRAQRAWPFPMAVSYGVAASTEEADAAALLRVADERMYKMKGASRAAR